MLPFVSDLIMDVGAHIGEDTDFYLRKGFRVVAVEAFPGHAAALRGRFESEIKTGRLFVEEVAIGPTAGRSQFLVHKRKSDWHRTELDKRRFTLDDFDVIEVEATTFDVIIERYGCPYYLKVDIEANDWHVIRSITAERRPPYVSYELPPRVSELNEQDLKPIHHLHALGYSAFKIIDQSKHRTRRCPKPAREGLYVDARFNGHMSGLFGRELSGPWLRPDETLAAIASLKHDGGQWYDLHAALDARAPRSKRLKHPAATAEYASSR